MKCPLCSVDLLLSEKQGVEIDYCPQCRGIWLDRGELEKIVEKAGSTTAGSNYDKSEENNKSYNNQENDKKKKGGGFFSNITDLIGGD